MASARELRELVFALAEVEERSHFDKADFRVAGKIFAGLSKEEDVGYAKLTPELQEGLVGGNGAAYYAADGAWGARGWTHFRLPLLKVDELRELLRGAYELVGDKSPKVAPRSPPRKRAQPRKR